MSHGIDVDIIELDPAVYHAARDYLGFGAPIEPRRVDLVDAAERVAEMARQERQKSQEQQSQIAAPTLYDFAIHDCFTGGSVPHELFSDAFWRDLATIMKPDGVVAVVSRGRRCAEPAQGHQRRATDVDTLVGATPSSFSLLNVRRTTPASSTRHPLSPSARPSRRHLGSAVRFGTHSVWRRMESRSKKVTKNWPTWS